MTDKELIKRAMEGCVIGNGVRQVELLAAEITRLRLYERACQSMAAQYIHPKITAEELARHQVEGVDN